MIMLGYKKYLWTHVISHALFEMHACTQHYTDTSLHRTQRSPLKLPHTTPPEI